MFKQKILLVFVFFIFFSSCAYISKSPDRPSKDIIEVRKKTMVLVKKYVKTRLSRGVCTGKGVLIPPRKVFTTKQVISADHVLMHLFKFD